MKKLAAITYFKTASNLARALGITRMSVSQWGEDIPSLRAFEIERITNGALKADFVAPQQLTAKAKG